MHPYVEMAAKYRKLAKEANARLDVLHVELKEARQKKDDNRGDWACLAELEDAKADHRLQDRVAKIYGQICYDFGDI